MSHPPDGRPLHDRTADTDSARSGGSDRREAASEADSGFGSSAGPDEPPPPGGPRQDPGLPPLADLERMHREKCRRRDGEPPDLPGLIVLGPIGGGGMGAIWSARDPEFERPLAVKVLKWELMEPDHDGRRPGVQRFLAETRITAQLTHPFIVPVHTRGWLADGRPYFAMRLIEGGKTLAELFGEHPDLQRRRAAFLQNYFAPICRAVAFAHEQGVIHRDLKPSNVMVGRHGEVQVMDWGLAKRLADPDAPGAEPAGSDDPPAIAGADSRDRTRPGSVLGTASYMSPESALGRTAEVDRRSDVFGLGAILCEILTGEPPRLRPTEDARLTPDLTQLRASGADAELIRLAERCLAPDPADRPDHAGDVASRITAYLLSVEELLQQERITRERERVEAEAERRRLELQAVWERRRRKLGLGLAAALLGAVSVSAIAVLSWQQQAAQRVQALSLAQDGLRQADEQLREGRIADARVLLIRARDRLGSSVPPAIRSQLDTLETACKLATLLQQIQTDRATPTSAGLFDNATAQRRYVAAFAEAGLPLEAGDAGHLVAAIRRSPVRDEILEAIDNWALVCAYDVQFEPSNQERFAARRDRLLQLARAIDPNPPIRDLIRNPEVWKDRSELEKLAVLARDDRDLTPRLAAFLAELIRWVDGDPEPLLRTFQARYRGDFWLNYDLGKHLRDRRPEEAVPFYQAALAIRPHDAFTLEHLASIDRDRNQYGVAIARYEEILTRHPDFDFVRIRLGEALWVMNRRDEALEQYQRCSRGALSASPSLAESWGEALEQQGEFSRAAALYRSAISRLAGLVPSTQRDASGQKVDAARQEATLHRLLGDVLVKQAEDEAAIREYGRAIDLDPDNAKAYLHLGALLVRRGEAGAAIPNFREAGRFGLAEGHCQLGLLLERRGDLEEAIRSYRDAVRASEGDAQAHYLLANALLKDEDLAGATEHYLHAVRLNPNHPQAHHNLGEALRQQGRFVEGLDFLRRGWQLGVARKVEPGLPPNGVRDAERSVALERKLPAVLAGRVQLADPAEAFFMGELCHYKQWYTESARFYGDALAQKPGLTNHHSYHRFRAACSAVLAAAEADSLDPQHRARLRDQARAWLASDLRAWQQELMAAPDHPAIRAEAAQKLRRWERTHNLAAVRDEPGLTQLTGDEQDAWKRLWRDAHSLLSEARTDAPR